MNNFVNDLDKTLNSLYKTLREDPHYVIDKTSLLLDKLMNVNRGGGMALSNTSAYQFCQILHLYAYAHFFVADFETSKKHLEKLYEVSIEYQLSEFFALAEQLDAKHQIRISNYDNAYSLLNHAQKTLYTFNNFRYFQASLIDLHVISLEKNEYSKALEFLITAEDSYKNNPTDVRTHIAILSGFTNVYLRIGNIDKAVIYAAKSKEEALSHSDIKTLGETSFRLATIYSRQKKHKEQIEELEYAKEILSENNHLDILPIINAALGDAYYQIKEYNKAGESLLQSLELFRNRNDKKNEAIACLKLALLYADKSFKDNDFERAKDYFNSAEVYAQEHTMDHFHSAILDDKAKVFYEWGDYQNAYECALQARELADKVLNETSLQRLRELEVRYEVQLKEKETKILQLTNKQLNADLLFTKKELVMKSTALLEQAKAITELKQQIYNAIHQLDTAENIVRAVRTALKESTILKESWEKYQELFEHINPEFEKNLRKDFPSLSKMECKVSILIRSGLTSIQIAELLSVSERTIENHRYNIRKKLSIPAEESLTQFLNKY